MRLAHNKPAAVQSVGAAWEPPNKATNPSPSIPRKSGCSCLRYPSKRDLNGPTMPLLRLKSLPCSPSRKSPSSNLLERVGYPLFELAPVCGSTVKQSRSGFVRSRQGMGCCGSPPTHKRSQDAIMHGKRHPSRRRRLGEGCVRTKCSSS